MIRSAFRAIGFCVGLPARAWKNGGFLGKAAVAGTAAALTGGAILGGIEINDRRQLQGTFNTISNYDITRFIPGAPEGKPSALQILAPLAVMEKQDGDRTVSGRELMGLIGPGGIAVATSNNDVEGDACLKIFQDSASGQIVPTLVLNSDSPAGEQQAAVWSLLDKFNSFVPGEGEPPPSGLDVDAVQAQGFPGALPPDVTVTPGNVKNFVYSR